MKKDLRCFLNENLDGASLQRDAPSSITYTYRINKNMHWKEALKHISAKSLLREI